jgi:flagella basal body P-ring formation protein FlgA
MAMKNLCSALCASLLLCVSPARAATQQDHVLIRDVALAYAQKQTESLPGEVNIKIEGIDKRTVLRTCGALEAFLPGGAQLIGKTSIGVRCNEQPGWSIFLQATIRVSATLLVANRPLAQNTLLKADDFTLQSGELGQPGILTDPVQAIGKTLKFGIGVGQALRQDMLRAPYVVTQGQTTEVRARGEGFAVRSSGQALNNGAEGQSVQVRMTSGQVITGSVTADGIVEVRH